MKHSTMERTAAGLAVAFAFALVFVSGCSASPSSLMSAPGTSASPESSATPVADGGITTVIGGISDPSPMQDSEVTVFARVTDDRGRPVEGARVSFSWEFKTLSRTDQTLTDASGVVSDTRAIGKATKGHAVRVNILAVKGGLSGETSGETSVSFVPR